MTETYRQSALREAPMSRWKFEKVIVEAMGLGKLTEESGGIALRICRTITWKAREGEPRDRCGAYWPRHKIAESHGITRERLDLAVAELEALGFVEIMPPGAILPTFPPNADEIAEAFRARIRRLNGWEV